MNKEKKPTTTGTKLSVLLILLFVGLMISNRDNMDDSNGAITRSVIEQIDTTREDVPSKPIMEEAEWVQPRIYPGIKLYYSHDGTTMRYIGEIWDAVGYGSGNDRTFGIKYKNGNKEYKYRRILWHGHWFMNRAQAEKIIAEFNAQ